MTEPSQSQWNPDLLQNPHAVADKRSRVQKMFSAIAPSYDLNNRLHSFWQDQRWRKKAVSMANLSGGDVVVDVACGTGDLSLAFYRRLLRTPTASASANSQPKVIGIDFTFAMLPLARRKSAGTRQPHAMYINGDAQALPLEDECCDVVSIAFGIRNVQEPPAAMGEFFRILRPGGRLIVLEFSQPTHPLIRWANDLYCSRIMPHTATWISGDRSGAYSYLPKSVATFASREKMRRMIQDAGFNDVVEKPLTFGVCVCYRGIKPAMT